jgi:hypothetical protein
MLLTSAHRLFLFMVFHHWLGAPVVDHGVSAE